MLGKLNCYVARVSVFLITAALIAGMAGCGPISQNLEIRNWYDLDAIRNNLTASYILMNDLDSTTAGYEELASSTANGGKGWQPIGTWNVTFAGTFDGQGYEICDLFINRPSENGVGLFGLVGEDGVIKGVIKDIGMMNVNVTGYTFVGSLVGENGGTVSNSYFTGSVTGTGTGMYGSTVGGLLGWNGGAVSNSYSTGSVIGEAVVGGLVGMNGYGALGTVSNSYSNSNVTGVDYVGGLVGANDGTVSNSYSTGSVTGDEYVGGLVGRNEVNNVSNSYSTGSVIGNSSVGGLVGEIIEGTVSNSYSTGTVTGYQYVGGLVGDNYYGTVSNSFWDIETSGQATSAGGTGKTTTEMQDIATFSGAGWNIIAVALNETNPTYIWNIVDGVTYPFLSW
jgi:hypothetical protein